MIESASAIDIEDKHTGPRVLCVDDEPKVLEGLENHLAMEYEVHLAAGPAEALDILERLSPFAVVISDMRMPQFTGAQLLGLVKSRYPDTQRMLLTGHADIESAAAAVNDGQICRYLTKPCPADVLLSAVKEAVRQNELIQVERSLLQETLNGAIEVLSHVIELAAPAAFWRSSAIAAYVAHMCHKLEITDCWEFEIAARLSQLGCIALPNELLEKARRNEALTDQERQMFQKHPEIGRGLVENIPRLERVSEIIARQHKLARTRRGRVKINLDDRRTLGGQLLAVAHAFDDYVVAGLPPKAAADAAIEHRGMPEALATLLADYGGASSEDTIQLRALADLSAGMILLEDVKTAGGQTVVRAGLALNPTVLAKLENFADGVGIVEPIRVQMPDEFSS